MASRPVWKGFIKFSLVSIPCRAYTAAKSGGGRIALNQLHKDCGARIKYQKVCPVHGEVSNDEIVSGYQFAADQYVIIEPEELAKLRHQSEKSINIEHFIEPDQIDLRYFSGRSIYLTPDGPIANKPYALLHRLLEEQKKVAFSTGVFNDREQIMLIRPLENLLVGSFLSFDAEVKPTAEFEPEVPQVEISKKELDLARTLVAQLSTDDFDFDKYEDQYQNNLEKLVEAKVAGKEIVAPPAEEEPQVINLMEALQKSVDEAKARTRPSKLAAPASAHKKAAGHARKRKTS